MLATLLMAAALAAPPAPTPGLATGLDAVITAAAAKGFAGEVLVTDLKGVTYAKAVSAPGRSHRRGEIWRWASVTKQLTATLTLQAVAAGKLSLDDSLASRLPDFRGPTARTVTIRMLLQHTSGLPNPDDTPTATPADFPAFYRRASGPVGGAADALGFCAGAQKAEPGAGFAYNNCDYIVLGAVLERASGKPYAKLLEEGIARPAGLATLKVASASAPPPATVPGVMEDGSREPPFSLATFGPAGAAYGRSDDLATFDRALLTRRLLDETQTAQAWAGNPKLGYVALGAWGFPAPLKGCMGSVRLVERRGEIGGVEVRNLLAPDKGLALIVFSDKAGLDFGEVWQAKGLTYDLASAAFCGA